MEKYQTKVDRKTHIDLIKFVAMLMVIMYHSTIYQYNFIENEKISYYLIYFFRGILSTCVPLFFFVNGYLILNKKMNLKNHIKKSCKLIFLTVTWGIISLIIIMYIRGEQVSPKEFILNLWKWNPIYRIDHLWYMGALICIYVFFPLIKNVYDENRNSFIYFLVVCFIFTFINVFLCDLGTIAINIIFGKGKIYSANLFNMFDPFRGIFGYTFVYFCLGGLIYNFEEKIRNINPLKRNAIAIVGIILSTYCLGMQGIYYSNLEKKIWDVVWDGYDTIYTFINVICIYILSCSYNSNNKFIYHASCNTLGIFFMHNIFIYMTKKYIISLQFFTTLIGNVVYAFLILTMCLLSAVIIKKTPIAKLFIQS